MTHSTRKKHVAENQRKFNEELKRKERKALARKLRYIKTEPDK